MKHQLLLATALVLSGTALIPALTAFGEILTFAGSLFGIDYHYRYKDEGK